MQLPLLQPSSLRVAAITLLVAGIVFPLPLPAVARPVSYTGGWTLIEETDRQATSLWVHHTLSPHWSVGGRVEWDRRQDFVFGGVQATWLAKRWFGEHYQANVYATGGLGVTAPVGARIDSRGRSTAPAAFAGLIADWETRRFFVSYRNRLLTSETLGDDFSNRQFFQAARVGVAPYVGDTGDLHTWLMVEVDHRPNNREPVGVTPLVRFFKGAALLELGWSVTDGQPLVNFTYRF
ncbi:MAG: hypothetical protein AAFY13_09180 [Pseudomonadota bacterium]